MIMKTRLIVIAALCGALLCSCGNRNKKAQKESVYKETIELTTVEGDHNLEATRIKIADSLVKDPKAGAVINERYTGMLPAADGPGIDYDLTIVRQEGVTRGVYALVTTYIEGENGRDAIFTETGRFVTLQGEGPNKGTEYLELTPSDDSTVHYFLKEKDGWSAKTSNEPIPNSTIPSNARSSETFPCNRVPCPDTVRPQDGPGLFLRRERNRYPAAASPPEASDSGGVGFAKPTPPKTALAPRQSEPRRYQ